MNKKAFFIIISVLLLASGCSKYSSPLAVEEDPDLIFTYHSISGEIIMPQGTLTQGITMEGSSSGFESILHWEDGLSYSEIADGIRFHIYKSSGSGADYFKLGDTTSSYFVDSLSAADDSYIMIKGIFEKYALTFSNFVTAKPYEEDTTLWSKAPYETDVGEELPSDILEIIIATDFEDDTSY